MRSLKVIFASCFPQRQKIPSPGEKFNLPLHYHLVLPNPSPQSPACLQTPRPSALVSHSAMSHLQPWHQILEVFGSFTQVPTAPTSLRMPSPSHSSREETPNTATKTFRLTEIRGWQQPYMQVSTFPDIPVQ